MQHDIGDGAFGHRDVMVLASVRPPKDRPCRGTADTMRGGVTGEARRSDVRAPTRVGGRLIVAIFARALDRGFGPPATIVVLGFEHCDVAVGQRHVEHRERARRACDLVGAGACELSGDQVPAPVRRLGGIEPRHVGLILGSQRAVDAAQRGNLV